MNDKLKLYTSMLDTEIERLGRDIPYYRSFLETSSRLYKYSFKDQVLIHAQRPNAVACAEYDTWGREDVTNRFVKRGSKGIALVDDSAAKTRLRYVFDFSDTGARDERSKEPFFWKITDETEHLVTDRLGTESIEIVSSLLEKAADMARNHSVDYLDDLIYNKDGSFLEELDDFNIKVRFEQLLEKSIAYTLLNRCGYDAETYIDDDDLRGITEFNTQDTFYVLGTAVSDLSEQVLREIEITLKGYERSKSYERNELTENNDGERDRVYLGRSDGNVSPQPRSSRGEADRQIRNASQNVPNGTPQGDVSEVDRNGQAERTSDGDRRSGSETAGRDYPENEERTEGDGTAQSHRPDEVGRNDEQHSGGGRGSDPERADIQLNSENEAVSEISDTASSIDRAKELINEYVNDEFDDNANFTDLSRIDLAFTTDAETDIPIDVYADLVNFRLVKLYGGEIASETQFDSVEAMFPTLANLEFDELVALSDEERNIGFIPEEKTLSDREILGILKRYDYIKTSKQEVLGFFLENDSSGDRADYLKSIYNNDYSEVIIDNERYGYKAEENGLTLWKGSFLSSEVKVNISWNLAQSLIAELIDKHEFLDIQDTFDIEPSVETAGGYDEPEIQQLSLFGDLDGEDFFAEPKKPKRQKEAHSVGETMYLIDELMRGSGFQDGKFRIDRFYRDNKPDKKELADFLRNEYGTGGHSGRGDVRFADHDYKGIRIELDSGEKMQFSWLEAAEKLAELVDKHEYITPDDVDSRIRGAYFVINNTSPETDRIRYEKAYDILVQYGLHDKNAELNIDMYAAENPDVFKIKDGAYISTVEIDATIEMWERFEACGLVKTENSEDKIMFEADGNGWMKFYIPDIYGNKFNNIDARDVLTPDEMKVLEQVIHQIIPEKEAPEISEFKSKTKQLFNPIGDTNAADIEAEIKEYAANVFAENGIEAEIVGIAVTGSRSRGIEGENSDIDVVIEVKSDIKEYALFNLLHEDDYEIGGVKVDINPIRSEETGTLDSYLAKADAYLEEKAESMEEAPDEEYSVKVGDVLELDDGKFKVTEITDTPMGRKLEMQDLTNTGWFPIFRSMYEDELFEQGFSLVEEEVKLKSVVIDLTPKEVPEKPDIPVEKHNFTITDENLGVGGAKTKFRANMDAINLLNELEFDGRTATPEEQEILSQYVGWGGLPQVFDENNSAWSSEFTELYTALSPEEYESARASTLNAHYTSPVVIEAIYKGLENLGFKNGNVLEPAMGVGNFFGMMPEDMRDSKLYGVELDSITGRIAKQLYQTADIQVCGFEKTAFPDNFFDVAVGNVPFGDYKLSEKRYDKLNLNIHDHFFAKSLDKVRAGGVVAFVTSKGTLDKADSKFRKYLAQRAELLGAIRLPNNAFKANAGTEVTTDIIFLQKRDKMLDIEPEWVNLGQTADGVPVNKYFEEHPEMILGEMKQGVEFSLYGNATETACVPIEGAVLKEQLSEAVSHIQGKIPDIELDEVSDGKAVESIPADMNVRNYSFTVVDDKVYYRENSRMNRMELPKATEERVKALVKLRDCVKTLIDYQLNEYSDSDIKEQQYKLNRLYDDFSKKFGLISSSANSRAFSQDSSYYLLSSLEILDEEGNLERKADIFTKRTIKQKVEVTSVDTASEALAVSISEKAKVDLPFMAQLTGKSEDEILSDLKGVVYEVPDFIEGYEAQYVTADEYLSGNIREKLEVAKLAAASDERFAGNVAALEQAMPVPLTASEIDVRLGATWIDTDIVKQFICETLQVPRYMQNMFDVHFSRFTSEWNVEGKNVDRNNVMANMTYGTPRKNAYSIIEDTLNLRDARVYDRVEGPDGKMTSVLNKKETMLAQEKQEAIKTAFKDWIFKDADRREQLVEKYNKFFNSTRPREYDGSHITFSGMTPEIELRPHQLNAIAHTMYGGNTLLAHQVGAGKTFEMVASAMESKRLGLCTKSLFVVPNHLTEQMGAEFLRLYPAANILVATKKDFEAKNRKRLCSKIATGDYDAVIIGHSQLEKIPVSQERQERMMRRQIREITEGIETLSKTNGSQFSVKQLEKTKRNLEAKLDKLLNSPRRDDVVTFEELGIDKLFVDEAHSFKNLFLYTKMRNVAGIQQTEAQKSADLYMKCQYLDELTGGKGLCFATGTPVSNSMTELYTMMRYLQADKLNELGMQNFDAWAANFGEAVTAIELAPEGTGYRAKTRFSKFFNLPELMNVFKEAADIKTADMLNLPVPEAHFHNIVVKPTETQKDMVADLSERAKKIHDKVVDPTEDNMLKVTNDGRKIGLDQRLINPLLPDEPCSKVNACIDNVFSIYEKTAEQKSTQLVFCDFSTPKNDGTFNLYDDIRDKLVARGVPKEEIAFIHDADTEVKKKELFSKVRQGKVRVLLGSTAKCGAGTNIQDKLIALHHLDCPWRPSDLEQREGRIIRQGNENKEVDVYRYMTEATFDAYLYQTIENKQRFISQIMSSKSPVRSCEDVDEATLSYAEVKALCAGNPLIKEKMDLDVAVTKLKVSKSSYVSQQYQLEDSVRKHFPERIAKTEQRIAGYTSDLEHLKAQPVVVEGISPMTVLNKQYTDKEEAGKAILASCKLLKSREAIDIGSYKGFDMSISYDSFSQEFHLDLQREMTYQVTLGTSEVGNITRIDNTLEAIKKNLENSQAQLTTLHEQLETAKSQLGIPFPQEQELNDKLARLAELNVILNIDENEVENASLAAERKANMAEKSEQSSDADKISDKKPSILGKIKKLSAEQSNSSPKPPTKEKSNEIT